MSIHNFMTTRHYVNRFLFALFALACFAGSAAAQIPTGQDTAAIRRALEQQAGRPLGVREIL